MADYQLTESERTVIRTADSAHIPNDPANRDYQEYLQWVEGGGVPDPYVPPLDVPPVPSAEQQVLFDHENRLLTMEGLPPITAEDFAAKQSRKT